MRGNGGRCLQVNSYGSCLGMTFPTFLGFSRVKKNHFGKFYLKQSGVSYITSGTNSM